MSNEPSRELPGIVYVGGPGVEGKSAEELARMVQACREHARHLGLAVVGEVVEGSAGWWRHRRGSSKVDGLLREHPGSTIVMHPGEDGKPNGVLLWTWLRLGVVIHASSSPVTADGPARLEGEGSVVGLYVAGSGGAVAADELARREAECRDYATACGLGEAGVVVLDDSYTSYGDAFRRLMNAQADGIRPVVIVHPVAVNPVAGARPDDVLWRWLGLGAVIRFCSRDRWAVWPWVGGTRAIIDLSAPASASHDAASAWSAPDCDAMGTGRRSGASAPGSADWGAEPRMHQAQAARPAYTASGPASPSPAPPATRWRPASRSEPLPHDGLFIRRNNAFGTRSVFGVADLIEHGVLIDQEQIRFDDFVAARTDQVPGPRSGEGVAVSHGLAAVPGDFKANEATTHFVEIALKAGSAPPDDGGLAKEPLPVNFVFVADTSYSMEGEKLDTVKSAIREIYTRLRPTDFLGIVTFDTHVRTVLKAVRKGDLPEESFTRVVTGLSAGGGTDINLGLLYGIDEISRNADGGGRTVDCLYLFSDGDPTSGETDWTRIRSNIAERIRGGPTLSCFGFGDDARMPELAALSGIAGGHSTFVVNPEDVRSSLVEDLSRRDHLAAIDIQLQIEIDPAIEIWHLYGHDLITDPLARAAVERDAGDARRRAREDHGTEALPDLITRDKGIRIFAPDLAFKETYWVVLEVLVPPGRELSGLGTATVQYVDTVARESRRHEITLAEAPTIPEETVTVHAVGLWTSEVTFYALDDLYDNDRESAKNRLNNHIRILQAAHQHVPAVEFRDDQVVMRKLITLTSSLGYTMSFTDGGAGKNLGYSVHAMNAFGRSRSGFGQRF